MGLTTKQCILSAVVLLVIGAVGVGIAKKDTIVKVVSEEVSAVSSMELPESIGKLVDGALISEETSKDILQKADLLDTDISNAEVSNSKQVTDISAKNICYNWLIASAEYVKEKGHVPSIPDMPGVFRDICITSITK